MGIRERLQARDALFISFADLLAGVAKAENVTEQEAAVGLSAAGVFSGVSTRLRLHGYGHIIDGGYDALDYEIDCAVYGGQQFVRDAVQHELNTGEVGFLCEDIAPALAAAGIAVPERLLGWLQPGANSAASASPKAARSIAPYVSRKWISLGEAADLLHEHNDGAQPGEWWNALADAADSQQIESGTWGAARDEQPLSHADIRAWCDAHGYAWPVPFPGARKPEVQACDAELRAELDQAHARIAELERECTELRKWAEAKPDQTAINSPTLQRIVEAVREYPAWRETQRQEPGLKAVLSWQGAQQAGKGNASRVAHVAHHVIAEHFGLKS